MSDSVLQSALPWVGHLPREERVVFLSELVDAVQSAATPGNDVLQVLVLLAQWRHTAEVYADRATLRILTDEPTFDHAPLAFPGQVKTPAAYPRRAEADRGLPAQRTAPATRPESGRDTARPLELTTLELRLSADRLAPYRTAGGGDLATGIALYEWNAELTAALGATLGHVEVLLRNAIHYELTAWSMAQFADPRWYGDPGGFLFAEELGDIAKACSRATRSGRQETPGRVIAELNLGFWRYLLSRRYDRGLWHPCLHRAFPGQRRRTVYEAVRVLHDARNRMAHHEPMFNRPVAELRATALRVAGWICPLTRDWIDSRCLVPRLLNSRPMP